jgi:small subunit ribosomal protein S13
MERDIYRNKYPGEPEAKARQDLAAASAKCGPAFLRELAASGGIHLAEKKKGKPQNKDQEREHGPDFKFIVRMVNTDIDGERKIIDGLTSVTGINYRISHILTRELGVPKDQLMGDLTDEDVQKLIGLIEDLPSLLPSWLMNRQRDIETGEDTHAISTDLDMTQKEDINLLRKMRSYRGIRHETGQKVRGQKSRSNGRTGATVGVSRKKAK